MKTTIAALALSIAVLAAVPVANAAPPARHSRIAPGGARDKLERMNAAHRRMLERHRVWASQAELAGVPEADRWTLQWEHEELLDAHSRLIDRSEWLLCSGRPAQEIEREQDRLFREHRRLLVDHLQLRRSHDGMVAAAVERNRSRSRVAAR